MLLALKEHTLSSFTGFTLSTCNDKTALNTSLDNVYCSTKIKIAKIKMRLDIKSTFISIQHIYNRPKSASEADRPFVPSSYATGYSTIMVYLFSSSYLDGKRIFLEIV